jgi:hypothetical protein
MQSFVALCGLVDQAPSDVVDGAAEADPHREPVAVVWKSSSISRTTTTLREIMEISVVNGW